MLSHFKINYCEYQSLQLHHFTPLKTRKQIQSHHLPAGLRQLRSSHFLCSTLTLTCQLAWVLPLAYLQLHMSRREKATSHDVGFGKCACENGWPRNNWKRLPPPGMFFFGVWQAVSRLDISNKSKKLKLGVLPHPSKVGTTKGRSRNLQTSLT